MTFWEFWNEHWFLAFWAIGLTAWSIVKVAKWVAIAIVGWPPEEF